MCVFRFLPLLPFVLAFTTFCDSGPRSGPRIHSDTPDKIQWRLVNEDRTDELNRSEAGRELIARIQMSVRTSRTKEGDIETNLKQAAASMKGLGTREIVAHFWRRGAKKGSASLPRQYRVLEEALLNCRDLADIKIEKTPYNDYFQFEMTLTAKGGEKIARVTTENPRRKLAIVTDHRVISDPMIAGPITGSRLVINGQFTQADAEEVMREIEACWK